MYWLSFCDVSLEEGQDRFLGCCLIDKDYFLEAVEESHRLGINSGGECVGAKCIAELNPVYPMNILLNRDDVKKYESKLENME